MGSVMVKHRIPVEKDGEEIVVHNTLSFVRPVQFEPGTVEKFEPQSVASSEGMRVEYVTERLAKQVWDEELIDVEDLGLEVIDPDDEEVTEI